VADLGEKVSNGRPTGGLFYEPSMIRYAIKPMKMSASIRITRQKVRFDFSR